MTPEYVADVLQRMLTLAAITAAPVLGAGLVVGLAVAVFQAATQVQESSLNFVPKLLAVGTALVITGPWALDRLIMFTQAMINELSFLGGGQS